MRDSAIAKCTKLPPNLSICYERPLVYLITQTNSLNIEKHYEYLPIIFLHRTINSSKKLGDPITQEERKYFREKDIANFESINNILQDLPPDLFFIIRASNLISIHCRILGGTARHRILEYTKAALK